MIVPIYPSQVLTGLQPFHHLFGYSPILAILRDERPAKPVDAESLGFSDQLWGLVQSCWSESSSVRPTSQQLFDHLSLASLNWVPPAVYPVKVTDDRASDGCSSESDSESL